MTEIRLSKKQTEVINLMQEGLQLVKFSDIGIEKTYLQKNKHTKIVHQIKVYKATFNFLHDKGIIKLNPKQNLKTVHRIYVLTEFGNNLKL